MTTSTTDPAPVASISVHPYSFGQSAQMTAEKAALYRDAAAQIATDLAQTIGESLNGYVVEPGKLIEVDDGGEIVSDPDAFDIASVRSGHVLSASVLTELSLALSLVTGMLGGGAMPAGPTRKLTSIERRVLDLLGQQFLQTALPTLLVEDDELRVDRSRDGAFNASDSDEMAASIGFSFRLQGPSGGGRLILAFHLSTIQQFSDTIDARLSGRRATPQVLANPQTAAALQPVPIPFSIGLGHVSLTARQLVELQVGDVIRTGLPIESDLLASVGGVDLYGVRLGQNGQTLTAHITSTGDPSTANAHARTGAS